MLALLRPEVFSAAHQMELYVLLWLGGIGRHRIIPHPLDSPQETRWLEAQPQEIQRLWRDVIDRCMEDESLKPASWEIAIGLGDNPAWSLPTPHMPIHLALDFLLQPYRILLENDLNDRAFLLALCGKDQRKVLEDAEARAWLVFEMGGGSPLIAKVEEARRSQAHRRRLSVMVDSDAMRPRRPDELDKDVEGELATRVRQESGQFPDHVHAHVLRRRSIENYLPVSALRKWARGGSERQEQVEAFEALSDTQRHYFSLKKGFEGDSKQRARAGTLYDRVPRWVYDRLAHGFGSRIARLFSEGVDRRDMDADALAEIDGFVREILKRMR